MARKINLFIVNLLIFVNCESRSLIQEDRNSTQGTNINLINDRDEFKSEIVYQNQKYDYDEIELFVKSDCKNEINKNKFVPKADQNSEKRNYELSKKILLDIKNYKSKYPYITRKRMRVDSWCRYTFCHGSIEPKIYQNHIESLDIIYNDNFLKFVNHEYITSRYNFDTSIQKYIYQNLFVLYNRIKASYYENYFKKRSFILNLYTKDDHISNLIFQFIDEDDEFPFLYNKYSKPILDKIILAFIVIGIKEYYDNEYEKSLFESREKFNKYLSNREEFLKNQVFHNDLKKFNLKEKFYLGFFKDYFHKFGIEDELYYENDITYYKFKTYYCSINKYPFTAYDMGCCSELFLSLLIISTILLNIFGMVMSQNYYIQIPFWIIWIIGRFCLKKSLCIRPINNLCRKIYCTNLVVDFPKMKEKIVNVIINSEKDHFLNKGQKRCCFFQKLLIKLGSKGKESKG